ncbi:LPXTG cell wall anchor domain-containing protein [Streptomyces albireticuli]|uniref:LPXTG cell wall anchor domain-containing protein n=1 Tax=Streptomyces albireticuli TaxID=1940 RepID=UPI00369E0961
MPTATDPATPTPTTPEPTGGKGDGGSLAKTGASVGLAGLAAAVCVAAGVLLTRRRRHR